MDQSQLCGMQQNDQEKINSFREKKTKKGFLVPYPAIENYKKGNYYLFFTCLRKKRLRQKKMRKGQVIGGRRRNLLKIKKLKV